MKAKDKVKDIFSPKKKEGGVVIMIGKPSKMKGKEMEDDDDKCDKCGKKGCKMKCGGKVKYQEGGKVTSNKKWDSMSSEEKAKALEKRQSESVKGYMFGSKPSKEDLKEREAINKMAEVRYKLADMYRKEADAKKSIPKKAKGGKVSKMKKGGKC